MPLPHLHRDWARACHICTGIWRSQASEAEAATAPALRESLERAQREQSEMRVAHGGLVERLQAAQRAITQLEEALADANRQCTRARTEMDAALACEAKGKAEIAELRTELARQQADMGDSRTRRDRIAELEAELSRVGLFPITFNAPRRASPCCCGGPLRSVCRALPQSWLRS